MNNIKSLSNTAWDFKSHLVWIPKYRKKILYGPLRMHLGDVRHELAFHNSGSGCVTKAIKTEYLP